MANPQRYATIAELRAEGLPGSATLPVTDAQCLILLERASQLVEQLTRNFFYARTGQFVFDGTNSYLLHLPNPIISVSAVYLNNDSVALDPAYYRAATGREAPNDDRYNPKIDLRRRDVPSIYSGFGPERFLRGYNQTVEGSFGFLEPDGTVPAPIKESVIVIVMLTSKSLYETFGSSSGGGGGAPLGPFKRERTDDHEIEYWQPDTAGTQQGLIVPQYVNGRLKLYRAPTVVKALSARWYE